mgnify:CR=1 FL=1
MELSRFSKIVSIFVVFDELINDVFDLVSIFGLSNLRVSLPFIDRFKQATFDLILALENVLVFCRVRLQEKQKQVLFKRIRQSTSMSNRIFSQKALFKDRGVVLDKFGNIFH